MKASTLKILPFLFAYFVLLCSQRLLGQEGFGKNRIQYQNFKWSQASTDNFELYYYLQSKSAATIAAEYAEFEFDRICDMLGYTPYSRLKLIVYASHSDLLQSNIGLVGETVFIGGYTVFRKNIIELAFNGIHTDLQRDIREGIARLILNEIFYSGNFKQVLQSSYQVGLPEWFLSGLVAYIAHGWTPDMDDRVRDLFLNKKFRKPNRFVGDEATTIGFSVWNYIAERYGRPRISGILVGTKGLRSFEKGIAEELQLKYKYFIQDWYEHYRSMYTQRADSSLPTPHDSLKIVRYTRDNTYYGNMSMSPDGNRLAYVMNKKGRYKVIVKNLKTNKKYVVYRGGLRSYDQKVDYQLPAIAWRNNDKIGVITVRHDKMRLVTYDIKEKIEDNKERYKLEVSNFFNIKYSEKQTYRGIYKHFKQVDDFSFSEDGATIVLSGENVPGQSDIFVYNLRNNNVTQITNDLFDDRYPTFTPKSTKGILFSSNRNVDTLMPKTKANLKRIRPNYDIFYVHTDSNKVVGKRLSNSEYNESQPKMLKNGSIYFLSDASGTNQLYLYDPQLKAARPRTQYRQGLSSYDLSNRSTALAFVMNNDGKRKLYLDTTFYKHNYTDTLPKTYRQEQYDRMVISYVTQPLKSGPVVTKSVPVITRFELEKSLIPRASELDTLEVDPDNYVFEFEKAEMNAGLAQAPNRTQDAKANKKVVEIFLRNNELYISPANRYKNDFGIDNVTTSLRIDPLRGTGMMMAANMSDIMANHRINAGLFGVFDFRSSIMYGEYEYLKHRLDFKWRVTKDILNYNPNLIFHKYGAYKYEFVVQYPINPSLRVSVSPFYMRTTYLNRQIGFLDKRSDYMGLAAEVNFDNNRPRGINMNDGLKFKAGCTQYLAPAELEKNFYKLYIDLRKYTRIHKDLTLANRLSLGGFYGRSPKNFLLGGMDNWLFNSTDIPNDAHPLATSTEEDNRDLLFLEYVTSLRGFQYSKQYGNKFWLINTELRLPIFKYLIRKQIRSNFIRNFQLATFYDIGMAWTGKNPLFSNENTASTQTITVTPFQARVTNYSNPYLVGYGFGFRSMVFGYYGKLDVGWGVQDFVVNFPRFYLTIGHDF